MNDQQYANFLEEMKSHIQTSIKSEVNGKIDRLTTSLQTYIKEDTAWKIEAQPAIDVFKNLTGAGKIIVILAIGVSAIVGAISAVKLFLKI